VPLCKLVQTHRRFCNTVLPSNDQVFTSKHGATSQNASVLDTKACHTLAKLKKWEPTAIRDKILKPENCLPWRQDTDVASDSASRMTVPFAPREKKEARTDFLSRLLHKKLWKLFHLGVPAVPGNNYLPKLFKNTVVTICTIIPAFFLQYMYVFDNHFLQTKWQYFPKTLIIHLRNTGAMFSLR
jgi:hypothetical protein